MTMKEMLHHVDHTQLKAYAAWEDIEKLCREAVEYETASVCIPPCYISRVKEAFKDSLKQRWLKQGRRLLTAPMR